LAGFAPYGIYTSALIRYGPDGPLVMLHRSFCSDPKKLDRKVALAIKLMPLGFELGRGQILEG
jgi:hypothetical protein